MADKEANTWKRHVINSVEEFRAGAVYEIPALRRTGSWSWKVHEVSEGGLIFSKVNGSSGGNLFWDERPGASTYDDQNRTVRQLVEDGEVVEVQPP
jgi:hypothetical protein